MFCCVFFFSFWRSHHRCSSLFVIVVRLLRRRRFKSSLAFWSEVGRLRPTADQGRRMALGVRTILLVIIIRTIFPDSSVNRKSHAFNFMGSSKTRFGFWEDPDSNNLFMPSPKTTSTVLACHAPWKQAPLASGMGKALCVEL